MICILLVFLEGHRALVVDRGCRLFVRFLLHLFGCSLVVLVGLVGLIRRSCELHLVVGLGVFVGRWFVVVEMGFVVVVVDLGRGC